jgi:hypothetical protein
MEPDANFVDKGFKDNSYLCPICWDTAVEPSKNPCGHYVCFKCIKEMFKTGIGNCHLCRKEFKDHIPIIDRDMQKKIKMYDEEAYTRQ